MAWSWLVIDPNTNPVDKLIRLLNLRMAKLKAVIANIEGQMNKVNEASNGQTSPSVFQTGILMLSNTVPTNVTGLSDGEAGQETLLWSTTANTTLVHNAVSFRMKLGLSVVMGANETRRFATVDGTNWRET